MSLWDLPEVIALLITALQIAHQEKHLLIGVIVLTEMEAIRHFVRILDVMPRVSTKTMTHAV